MFGTWIERYVEAGVQRAVDQLTADPGDGPTVAVTLRLPVSRVILVPVLSLDEEPARA